MKRIQRYVADDGREFLTEAEALKADRQYRLDSIYAKHPLRHKDEEGYGHTVPVYVVIEWLQGDPEVVAKLAAFSSE